MRPRKLQRVQPGIGQLRDVADGVGNRSFCCYPKRAQTIQGSAPASMWRPKRTNKCAVSLIHQAIYPAPPWKGARPSGGTQE